MGKFQEEQPANVGAGTQETDPVASLFNARYVFGEPVLAIEDAPGPAYGGGGAAPLSALEAPVDVTLPAGQEPTPAALGGPAPANANEKWFFWPSGQTVLVVTIPNGADVRSLWFPVVDFAVQISAGQSPGNVMYEITTQGGELVPIPAGAPAIALSAMTGSTWPPLWVLAAGVVYPPFKAPAAEVFGASSTYDALVLADPTLQYYWPLNDHNGTTLCQDYGPANNPLIAEAGVTLGVSGLLFDGETAAFSNAADTAYLIPQSAINIDRGPQTIELWIFAQGPGVIFDGNNQGLTILINANGTLGVCSGFSFISTSVVFPQNATAYVVATINNSVLDVYLNGALALSCAYGLDATSLTFLSYQNNSGHLVAKIEKIAIYAGVYTLSQIRTHYAAGRA